MRRRRVQTELKLPRQTKPRRVVKENRNRILSVLPRDCMEHVYTYCDLHSLHSLIHTCRALKAAFTKRTNVTVFTERNVVVSTQYFSSMGTVCDLSRIKVIEFVSCSLIPDTILKSILSCCTALEVLNLIKCHVQFNWDHILAVSQSLSQLEILSLRGTVYLWQQPPSAVATFMRICSKNNVLLDIGTCANADCSALGLVCEKCGFSVCSRYSFDVLCDDCHQFQCQDCSFFVVCSDCGSTVCSACSHEHFSGTGGTRE